MNGKYPHPLRSGTWTLNISEESVVQILCKKEVALENDGDIHLYINSKKNDFGWCRSIFFLKGVSGAILGSTCLLQYHLSKESTEEVEFEVAPHGNRKHGRKPFYPLGKAR